MKPTLLILAAGLGNRYGGLKQMDQVGPSGETLLEYAVYDAIRAGFGRVVFIIQDFFAQDFKQKVTSRFTSKIEINYAYQTISDLPAKYFFHKNRSKPWGTGHAVYASRSVINEPFVVINADDFYGPSGYQIMADYIQNQNFTTNYAMVGYKLKNTLSPHGSVNRGICEVNDGYLQTTIERTGIPSQLTGKEGNNENLTLTGYEIVSMNFWGFTPQIFTQLEQLFIKFLKQLPDLLNQEFYLPDAVSALISLRTASVRIFSTQDQWFGITYREDKSHVAEQIRKLVNQGIYPENLWE